MSTPSSVWTLPLELIERIAYLLARIGTRSAVTAALIHPSFTWPILRLSRQRGVTARLCNYCHCGAFLKLLVRRDITVIQTLRIDIRPSRRQVKSYNLRESECFPRIPFDAFDGCRDLQLVSDGVVGMHSSMGDIRSLSLLHSLDTSRLFLYASNIEELSFFGDNVQLGGIAHLTRLRDVYIFEYYREGNHDFLSDQILQAHLRALREVPCQVRVYMVALHIRGEGVDESRITNRIITSNKLKRRVPIDSVRATTSDKYKIKHIVLGLPADLNAYQQMDAAKKLIKEAERGCASKTRRKTM